ncbi:MAG TPA: hypothetical protein VIK91_00355 [Nannocystis sp.]
MRATLPALAALLAACEPAPAPGLVLDVGRVCGDITLAVADADVLPGHAIHAAAIPRSGADAAWLVAGDPNQRLWLRRVPEDIPGVELTSLGPAHQFTLERGPIEGHVWLTQDRDDGVRVWRVDEATGTIATSPQLLPFPDAATAWIRRTVFVSGSPHLVAFPRKSEVGRLRFYLTPLDASLASGVRWTLEAEVACAPLSELSCPLLWDDERDVAVLDVAEAGSIAGAAILLAITTPPEAVAEPEAPPSHVTHFVTIVIQRDAADGAPVVTRRDFPMAPTQGPTLPRPAQLAADPLGLYVLVGLIPGPDSSGANASDKDFLYRTDLVALGMSESSDLMALLPKETRSHLLQLGSRVALGQLRDGTWHVAPIEDATIRAEIVGSLAVGDEVVLHRAGRAQVVFTGGGLPSRRATIACGDREP